MFISFNLFLDLHSQAFVTQIIYHLIGLILLKTSSLNCFPSAQNPTLISKHHLNWTLAAAASTNQTPLGQSVRMSEISNLRNRCKTAEADLDRCSAQLIAFGSSEAIYPDSMEALNTVYCPNFRKVVSCIRTSSDCYRPFERQIINWILTSTRRMNYKRCKNENEKEMFLKLTNSCFSLMKNSMDKCMSNYISQLESVSELNYFVERASDSDIQIQLSCCANRRFRECSMSNAKRLCKPQESLRKLKRTNSVSSQRVAHRHFQRSLSDMMDDLKSTLDDMSLTGPGLICQSVDEHFCKTNFDGKFNGRFTKHKSIVPAMLKIYSNK